MILTWEKKVAKNPIHEMEGERARDRRRRKNSITACAAHFNDLIEAYPKGVPLAKDRKARAVTIAPAAASVVIAGLAARPWNEPTPAKPKRQYVPRRGFKDWYILNTLADVNGPKWSRPHFPTYRETKTECDRLNALRLNAL